MKHINNTLIERRQTQKNAIHLDITKMGIFLPTSTFEEKERSFMLVGILNSNISCFNTKKRVPYKIVLELVDPYEFYVKKFPFQLEKPYKIPEAHQKLFDDFLHSISDYDAVQTLNYNEQFQGFENFVGEKLLEEPKSERSTSFRNSKASYKFSFTNQERGQMSPHKLKKSVTKVFQGF